jgi:8-oxo-dGTP pyrophosphatase MutT (NUDIX family)
MHSTTPNRPLAAGATPTFSPTLSGAILHLRQEFQRKSNDQNVFPLFPPKAHEKVWQTVKLDNSRTAAVLVPLVSYQGKVSLLFTRRSAHLPTHANEVSFPGGHFDASVDETLEDTALREAKEELLGNDYLWDKVEIIGRASTLPSIKGTPVTPIIGVLPYEIHEDTFLRDPREVDEIFCVSLQDLMAMEMSDFSERFGSNIPVYPAGENRRIWGLTAVVTRPLLHKLFKSVFQLHSLTNTRLVTD